VSESVGVAIIGVGGIVRKEHLRHLAALPDVRLVGYLRTKSGSAERAVQQYGGRLYDTVEQLVDDPAVRAVYVSVPPFAHGDIERKVLAAGKAMFVEKPLAINLETAQAVADQIKATNALVAVGYHWRYQSTTAELRKRLGSGPVIGATGWWCGGRPGVWWWRDKATGGGQPAEQTTHVFDLANYLVQSPPLSVLASARKLDVYRDDPKHTVDDVSVAHVRYADGTAVSIWSSDVMNGAAEKVGLELYGIDSRYEIGLQSLKCWQGSQMCELKVEGNAFQRENVAFIHAVRTGDRSVLLADYDTAMVTHRVTMAVERSIKSGQVEAV
jgi:predicted dehydrogenase